MSVKIGKSGSKKTLAMMSTKEVVELTKSSYGKDRSKAKTELDKRLKSGLKLERYVEGV